MIKKAREAMLAAIQTFNDPQALFRSEIFIVLCIIAWTYALHAFLKRAGIHIAYLDKDKTTPGDQQKHWELSKCLNHPLHPLDAAEKTNITYFLDIRHATEHLCTGSTDVKIASCLQAAALKFNTFITKHIGGEYRLDTDFSVAIQMSSFSYVQARQLYSAIGLENRIEAATDGLENKIRDDI